MSDFTLSPPLSWQQFSVMPPPLVFQPPLLIIIAQSLIAPYLIGEGLFWKSNNTSLLYDSLVGGPETSAGQVIWQSFEKEEENIGFIGSRKKTAHSLESECNCATLKKGFRNGRRVLCCSSGQKCRETFSVKELEDTNNNNNNNNTTGQKLWLCGVSGRCILLGF